MLTNERNFKMPQAKTKTTEIDNIREDVQSLKSSILALSKQVEADGKMTAANLKIKAAENVDTLRTKAQENIANFQDYSKEQLADVEKEIKAHPGRSIALAFGAGLLLSALMRRG
jgi:ElaB/YqjD/DUF883 family membrane-anchored ribosome-binding protein